MEVLVFIPARGGSKGITNKNLHNLGGKPLIEYTLEVAKELKASNDSKIKWEPFLSSDDHAIIDFCRKKDIYSKYVRPEFLAQDNSSMVSALIDGVEWNKECNGYKPDYVLLLQPTSPFREIQEIIGGMKKILQTNANTLISVTSMKEHPYECIDANRKDWRYIEKNNSSVPGRQEYQEKFYFIDGNFYLIKTDFLLKEKILIEEGHTELYPLERAWPVDIDTPEDILLAEAFIDANNE